jgi:hypothetical protein
MPRCFCSRSPLTLPTAGCADRRRVVAWRGGLVGAAVCGILLFAVPSSRADERIIRKVDDSPLKELKGFAERYPADRGIADDSRVIFADNFESGDFSAWDRHTKKESIVSLVPDPAGDPRMGERSMKVTATLGENTGGGATKWFESSDPLFIRFYVKFAADCDYTHHLARIRANKGLRGNDKWSGFGQAGIRPRGDERFVTGVEPWGGNGRFPPPGRWDLYTYWPEMKPSGDGKYWGNQFMPEDEPVIERDRWIGVELMIKHNTPGRRDGEQAFWIDGELRGHWTGFLWRTSPTLWANSLALESYVTDRWTKNKVNTVWFDNVVVARNYIGPSLE